MHWGFFVTEAGYLERAVELARLGLHEFEFGGMPRPEGEGERNGVFVLGLYREDLSILARPELVGVCHGV